MVKNFKIKMTVALILQCIVLELTCKLLYYELESEVLNLSQINVTIRMDRDLKGQAEKLFNELGLNMTTALTMFIKTAVREQRIPFELSLSSFNAQTLAAIRDIEDEKNLVGPFDDIGGLMESSNAEN